MEKCPKCGNLLDENGICNDCSADVSSEEKKFDLWSRPGSVSVVKKTDAYNTDNVGKSSDDALTSSEPSASTAVKQAQSQIGTAEQRAAYFNAVAGVEEEEIDEQFYVSETGLFDVPFNDTKENLGFNFPKFRHAISKKTRKKIKIGSLIVASVAALTAGVIFLLNYFGINLWFFNRNPVVPVLYVAADGIYMTTSKGDIAVDINYSDNRLLTLSDTILDGKVKRLSYSSDYKRMFTVEKYDAALGTYTLFERETYSDEWRKAKSNGVLVDNSICSEFKTFCNGKAIVYLKLIGDEKQLCVYSFENGAVKAVADGVKSFGVVGENEVLFIQDGNLQLLTYKSHSEYSTKEKKKSVEQVVTAYDYGYTDSGDYFYLTEKHEDLRQIENREYYNTGDLHYIKAGKDIMVDMGVSEIVMPCFGKGTVYYYKERITPYSIGDFIEDDCAESDAAYVNSVGYNNIDFETVGFDELMKFLRHNLRNISYGNQRFSIMQLGIHNELQADLWYADSKKENVVAENVSGIVEADEKSGVIVCQSNVVKIEKIKFSDVEQPYIKSEFDLINYCRDVRFPTMKKFNFSVCNGAKSSVLEASYVRYAECTDDSSRLYFIDTEKRDTESGVLKYVKLNDLSSCEAVLMSVASFEVIGNTPVSLDAQSNLYYNNEKIGQNVKDYKMAEKGKTIIFLSDYDAYVGTGTLKLIKNKNVEILGNNISEFTVYNNTTLAYIGDYNKAEKTGTLYLANGIKTGKATANKARSLVRY